MNELQPRKLLIGDEADLVGCWGVEVTDNGGKVESIYQYSYEAALAYSTLIMMPDIHMLIIKRDDVDFQRFDRTLKADSNKWYEIEELTQPKTKGVFTNFLA